ncbi:MAG TPA: ankyrin repeat domain-containing protein [Planctomycetota bacterium]|nr:ankyrin repeat domain-containing protein [Planctomycetota bacterium]
MRWFVLLTILLLSACRPEPELAGDAAVKPITVTGYSLDGEPYEMRGLEAMFQAVMINDIPLARGLLEEGSFDVNFRLFGIQDGWTLLHHAAQKDRCEIAEMLLKHGADVNARAGRGVTPLTVAVSNKVPEMAGLLRKAGGTE